MSYIERNLLPDERVLFRTKKHIIIFLLPVLLLIFSAYATSYMAANDVLAAVQWAPWFVTVLIWCNVGLNYITSEFVVTNKRVLMREGFFVRHSNELRLATISQVNVEQSIFGQILNYGTVSLNAFGAFDAFPLIAKPFLFQKAVNQQLDQVVSGR